LIHAHETHSGKQRVTIEDEPEEKKETPSLEMDNPHILEEILYIPTVTTEQIQTSPQQGPYRYIRLPVELETLDSRTKISLTALIDSGVSSRFIDRNFVQRNNMTTTKLEQPIPVFNVDGTKNQAGSIIETVKVIVHYKEHSERIYLYVTNLGTTPLIFGISWLRAHSPSINWRGETIDFNDCPVNCQKIGTLTRSADNSPAKNDHIREEDEHDDEHDEAQKEHICWMEWKANYELDKKIALDKKLNDIVPTHLHEYLHVFDDVSATRFPIS
jgi:hypothetical protein